uniref:Uncharacterized protein n=1 Tax=Skeletonema marinoi TaxID=267567 RepID=A0A7S2L9F4_9STRA|mmetsp:Transcript_22487/g.38344  ORF Transcript_22487/g.38344 Transcript_22487/m.38344 type:complete len:539 (+) Transcript_22487:1345-2961(+)
MTAGARQGRYRDEFLSSNQLADTDPSLANIADFIAQRETIERVKYRPHLSERAPNVEIDDVLKAADKLAEEEVGDHQNNNPDAVSLRHLNLKEFSLDLLCKHHNSSPSISLTSLYTRITMLDVSNNELSQLPGLSSLCNLEKLCLRRNWFNSLPTDIGMLSELRVIDASRNFLKPNEDSLHFQELNKLEHLEVLDVSLNQKCRTAEHRELIQKNIAPSTGRGGKEVEVLVTIWQEMTSAGKNNTIGESAAVRNPALLRSQLEPWGTVNLRRRLVRDFGQEPTHPKLVDRAGVMNQLLQCYKDEGLLHCADDDVDLNNGVGQRQTVVVDGVPVRKELLDEILTELQDWRGNNKRGGSSNNRERPSIKAESYMILCAPPPATSPDSKEVSRRERRRNKKMEGNRKLWDLALQAMKEIDPEFAARCSEIAVTYRFIGSPHIDRQNSSHFYGLSLGNFAEGTGCVAVEMSPRVVAEVNTKNRLGKVDGRYPHWVSNYNIEDEERFSLIYYDTLSSYQTPGPAIFSIPHDKEGNKEDMKRKRK